MQKIYNRRSSTLIKKKRTTCPCMTNLSLPYRKEISGSVRLNNKKRAEARFSFLPISR